MTEPTKTIDLKTASVQYGDNRVTTHDRQVEELATTIAEFYNKRDGDRYKFPPTGVDRDLARYILAAEVDV